MLLHIKRSEEHQFLIEAPANTPVAQARGRERERWHPRTLADKPPQLQETVARLHGARLALLQLVGAAAGALAAALAPPSTQARARPPLPPQPPVADAAAAPPSCVG